MLGELRVTPVGSNADFAQMVAGVIRIVADSDLQYQVHAMGTTLEGDLNEILDVVRRCHEDVRKRSERILIEISIDDRGGAEGELVRSVNHVRDLEISTPVERLTKSHPRIDAQAS